jgi:glycine/D-amino acid oxidase-like deaminating enzyme
VRESRPSLPDPGGDRSFWLQEALAGDPGEPCPPLQGKIAADVCVVGGGFAGLWTALELSEREPTLRIVILEADVCGGGASGRNGGFISSSWHDLEGLCGLYGDAEGLRYARELARQVGELGEWCSRNGVDCWFHHDGILWVEAGEWQRGKGRRPLEYAASRGLADEMVRLRVTEIRELIDSPRVVGGGFVRDGGTVQPARLARGLRRVALSRGVRIFEQTSVTGMARRRPAVVGCERGAVRADQVVLTIGPWAAAWPGFRRTFSNMADYVVATEPIPSRLAEVWPSDVGVVDGRELIYYLRKTDDGRVVIGGGRSTPGFGGRVGRWSTHDRRSASVAAEGLLWLLPQLEGVRFTHAWGGPMDMTASWTPFFQTLAPGNVHAGLGFSGHGLAATKLGGKTLASLVLGSEDEWSTLPVVGPPARKVPPEPLRWPLVRAAIWGLESGDRREAAGRRRGLVRSVIGNAPVGYRAGIRALRGRAP